MGAKYGKWVVVWMLCGLVVGCGGDLTESGRLGSGSDAGADVVEVDNNGGGGEYVDVPAYTDAPEYVDAPELPEEDTGEVLADVSEPEPDISEPEPDVSEPKPDVSTPEPEPEPEPCMTRITYGSTWIRGNRTTMYDDVQGKVTWNGVCKVDGAGNAYAELSNGWKPFFQGRSCVIALDYSGACSNVPNACRTRVSYGPTWDAPANHPNRYDQVAGVVTWDGTCRASGGNSVAELSNGWKPHFRGANSCDIAMRYEQCGGLYQNPVIAANCPDPSVLKDGSTYYLTCTHTGGSGIFPIYTSKDLVNWTRKGSILGSKPGWANNRFWAPEIHRVANNLYVAYYSASTRSDDRLSIGAATATSPLGPYKDLGRPLVYDPTPGVIDAHYFQASNGKRYLTWKRDGNAIGRKTPILIQEVAADGVTLTGPVKEILTNTLGWEGHVVEGQWIIERGEYFYLFYSGNGYASPNYGIGVARATSPMGPYTKAGAAILTTSPSWDGPGHGAVIKGPSGDWVHVYHAWPKGKVGQESVGRHVLVDRISWANGWPRMLSAPSKRSQPLP